MFKNSAIEFLWGISRVSFHKNEKNLFWRCHMSGESHREQNLWSDSNFGWKSRGKLLIPRTFVNRSPELQKIFFGYF